MVMTTSASRIDDAVSRLVGHARKLDTEKGLAKDIRAVVDALSAAQGALVMAQRDDE